MDNREQTKIKPNITPNLFFAVLNGFVMFMTMIKFKTNNICVHHLHETNILQNKVGKLNHTK